MNHYFEYNPELELKYHTINVDLNDVKFDLTTTNNVFSFRKIDTGTKILLETLSNLKLNNKVLDLGCGYGVVSIYLKLKFPNLNLYASDVNEWCVTLTKNNAKKLNLDINVIHSDSFTNVNEIFDFIVFNPPISVGKDKIYSMYQEAYEHLNSHGHFYIVIRKDKGALSHMKYLSSLYQKVEIINKEKGYFVILAIKE